MMAEIVLLKDREHDTENCKRVIANTDKDIDVYDVLIIDGRKYSVCSKILKTGKCGVREIEKTEKQKLDYESEFTCPYCGEVDTDAWELTDNDGETECGSCGAVLEYERHIEVTYSTKVKEPPNVMVIDGVMDDE